MINGVDFKAKTEKVVITPYVNGDMDTENAVTLNLDIKNATATAFSMLVKCLNAM